MIQSMKNGKHTTSSQLWARILHKNWGVRNLTVDQFTPGSMRLFQMLGFFLCTGIAMKVISVCISILRTCQFFLSNPLKSGNAKFNAYVQKNSTHKSTQPWPHFLNPCADFLFILHDRILLSVYFWPPDIILQCTDQSENTDRSPRCHNFQGLNHYQGLPGANKQFK